ncbi:MAG: hypothetical protein RI885_2733 [Actinomycetota bacterium]
MTYGALRAPQRRVLQEMRRHAASRDEMTRRVGGAPVDGDGDSDSDSDGYGRCCARWSYPSTAVKAAS